MPLSSFTCRCFFISSHFCFHILHVVFFFLIAILATSLLFLIVSFSMCLPYYVSALLSSMIRFSLFHFIFTCFCQASSSTSTVSSLLHLSLSHLFSLRFSLCFLLLFLPVFHPVSFIVFLYAMIFVSFFTCFLFSFSHIFFLFFL